MALENSMDIQLKGTDYWEAIKKYTQSKEQVYFSWSLDKHMNATSFTCADSAYVSSVCPRRLYEYFVNVLLRIQ